MSFIESAPRSRRATAELKRDLANLGGTGVEGCSLACSLLRVWPLPPLPLCKVAMTARPSSLATGSQDRVGGRRLALVEAGVATLSELPSLGSQAELGRRVGSQQSP